MVRLVAVVDEEAEDVGSEQTRSRPSTGMVDLNPATQEYTAIVAEVEASVR